MNLACKPNKLANMLKTRVILISVIMLILSGCVTMESTDSYRPIPVRAASVNEVKQDTSKSTLVQGPIDLGRAIDIALTNNPEMRHWIVGGSLDVPLLMTT